MNSLVGHVMMEEVEKTKLFRNGWTNGRTGT